MKIIDRACVALGLRTKIVAACENRFVVRRLSADEPIIGNTLDIPTGTVVDIGAGIGAFAIQAARKAIRVIAIEPNYESYCLLLRNIQLNGLRNVEAINYPLCVRDEDGLLQSLFAERRVERCGLLRLNARRLESTVLRGMSALAAQQIARAAVTKGERDHNRTQALTAILTEHGFTVANHSSYLLAQREHYPTP